MTSSHDGDNHGGPVRRLGRHLSRHRCGGAQPTIDPPRGGAVNKVVFVVCLAAGLLLLAAPAQAATTVEKNIPFNATINACGETITLAGTLMFVLTVQPMHGGGILLTSHFQPQGVAGTSSSGVPYHATGLTRETIVVVPAGGTIDTFINRFHIVGTRGAPTYYVKETVHLTLSPTGAIKAYVNNFSLQCT